MTNLSSNNKKDKAFEDKILSSLVESLENKASAELIKYAQSNGKIIFRIIPYSHLRSNGQLQLDLELTYEDYSKMNKLYKPYDMKSEIVDALNKISLRELVDYYRLSINDIDVVYAILPEDKGLHKTNETKEYFKSKIDEINSYINSDIFSSKSNNMLQSLHRECYDDAIGQARTTLETFMKIIVKKNGDELKKGFNDLFNQTITIILKNRQEKIPDLQNNDITPDIKTILDTLMKAISNTRCTIGYAHGLPQDAVLPLPQDAYLVVESTITILSYMKKNLTANAK